MNRTLMQLRREFWENHMSFVRTPLLLGAVLVALAIIGLVPSQGTLEFKFTSTQHSTHEAGSEQVIAQQSEETRWLSHNPEFLSHGLAAINGLFIFVLLLVLSSYLSSALYNDRRDHSILFWKSLPVTETRNVLTKLGAALAGAPLFYGAAALATGTLYLIVFLVYGGLILDLPLPSFGQIVSAYLGSMLGLIAGWILLALWSLPIFCWLLFTGAASKRAPFLIAMVVPLLLMVAEAWILGSTYLFKSLKIHAQEALSVFVSVLAHPDQLGDQLSRTFSAPILWVGFALSGLLLTASIWLRNYRYEL